VLLSERDFLGGAAPNRLDCKVLPALRVAAAALKEYRDFDLAEYPAVGLRAYTRRWEGLDAYKKTYYSDEAIVAGWKSKVGTTVMAPRLT